MFTYHSKSSQSDAESQSARSHLCTVGLPINADTDAKANNSRSARPNSRWSGLHFFAIPALLFLSACSWVDSTGVQTESRVVTLQQGNVLDLIENESLILDPTDSIDPRGEISIWRWSDEPIAAGNLRDCRGINGFNQSFVQESLPQACTRAGDCELYFEETEVSGEGGTHSAFRLRPPTLRAPVGVTYQLFATTDGGEQRTFDFTFCLIAVNEAPDAVDDVFTVLEDETLVVSTRGPNLLSNDSDDIDASNQALRVDPQVVRAPRSAVDFELFDNGGFRYVPQAGFRGVDSFVYRITDGFAESQATATISVRAANLHPRLQGELPELALISGVPVDFSYAPFFIDPEGSALLFSARGLPDGLQLSSSGSLSGAVVAGEANDFNVTISVTDGVTVLDTDTSLSVSANQPPLISVPPVLRTLAGRVFSFAAAPYFTDPEGQQLEYVLQAPSVLSLAIDRRTGVVSGVPGRSGSYLITVLASDGVTLPVEIVARLEVAAAVNRRPVYSGAIANQTVASGTPIDTIEPSFVDPDGDSLSFELQGSRPAGLVFNTSTGVLSGSPTRVGIYRNLSITATDDGDLSVTSDAFNIIVTAPPPPNRAPLYSGALPNIVVPIDVAIEPFAGNFSDPDDDELTYRIIDGPLPAGLSLNANGFVTGVPTSPGRSPVMRIEATDPDGESVESDLFRVTVVDVPEEVNTAPVIEPISNQQVELDETLEIQVDASDVDDDELAYSIDGSAAEFLEIDGESGLIEGAFDAAGTYRAQVTVTDGTDAGIRNFSVVVLEPNSRPIAVDIPNRVLSGQFSFTVDQFFTDPDDDELTFTAANLPDAVVITSDGQIRGTANSENEGNHFIVVTADDGRGGTISDGFRLGIVN